MTQGDDRDLKKVWRGKTTGKIDAKDPSRLQGYVTYDGATFSSKGKYITFTHMIVELVFRKSTRINGIKRPIRVDISQSRIRA